MLAVGLDEEPGRGLLDDSPNQEIAETNLDSRMDMKFGLLDRRKFSLIVEDKDHDRNELGDADADVVGQDLDATFVIDQHQSPFDGDALEFILQEYRVDWVYFVE